MAELLSVLHAGGGLLGSLIYLATVAFLSLAIVGMTGGHFVYTLDDPYIHLALAERIRTWLYGINAGEFASPSSSIVWPLVFVPFAHRAWLQYLPLFLNALCGVATVFLLALCIRRSFGIRGVATDRRARLLVVLLTFALNLPGLTLTGMEHVLQVLLSVCCAYAVLCIMDNVEPPGWTLLAAMVLPSVRYEGFLLTAAVALALSATKRRRDALLLVGCSAMVPLGFSLFLRHLGLPALPLSVLLKSSAQVHAGTSMAARVTGTMLRVALATLRDPERAPELILSVVLGYLARRSRTKRTLFFCALGGFCAATLQTIAGPNGWFFRYEIYALAFTLLLAIALDARTPESVPEEQPADSGAPFRRRPSGLLLVAVAGLAAVYMQPLLATPAAALGIYEQQFQVARLTHDFYKGRVAVNDLGLVSFNRAPTQYVLDLYGLGSLESARVSPLDKTPAWLDHVTREHQIGLVAVYPEWFKQGVPNTWVPLGKLCSPHAPVSAVYSRVIIYATAIDAGNVRRVNEALQKLTGALPPVTTVELHPENSLNTCLAH